MAKPVQLDVDSDTSSIKTDSTPTLEKRFPVDGNQDGGSEKENMVQNIPPGSQNAQSNRNNNIDGHSDSRSGLSRSGSLLQRQYSVTDNRCHSSKGEDNRGEADLRGGKPGHHEGHRERELHESSRDPRDMLLPVENRHLGLDPSPHVRSIDDRTRPSSRDVKDNRPRSRPQSRERYGNREDMRRHRYVLQIFIIIPYITKIQPRP
jgi:hypothetical protein